MLKHICSIDVLIDVLYIDGVFMVLDIFCLL